MKILVFCLFFYYFSWYSSPRNVICFHLGILRPAFSGGTRVTLFYYHRWKHIFPWCRRQKGCNPQSKAQGLAPLPGLAVVFTFWFPYHTPYCSYFPNSRGFWKVSPTAKSKTSQKSETQQSGANSDSLRGFTVFLKRSTFWWGQNGHLFLSFHLFFTINGMRIGKIS